MLYNPVNQIFAWLTTKNEKSATDSLLGIHKALYENNYVIDFVHPTEFKRDILSNYKCLYIPFPYVLNEQICQAIKRWVEQGGILIGESYFAGWNIEQGHHEKTIPGYGLETLFQAEQYNTLPVSENDGVAIRLDQDLFSLKKGKIFSGMMVQQQLTTKGAEVLAVFADCKPAITIAKHGKGKAILIGSYLGMDYYRNDQSENGRLIASLVQFAGIEKTGTSKNEKIRIDVIFDDQGNKMLIINNLNKQEVDADLKISLKNDQLFTEQFDGEKLPIISDGEWGNIRLTLKPSEVRVYVSE